MNLEGISGSIVTAWSMRGKQKLGINLSLPFSSCVTSGISLNLLCFSFLIWNLDISIPEVLVSKYSAWPAGSIGEGKDEFPVLTTTMPNPIIKTDSNMQKGSAVTLPIPLAQYRMTFNLFFNLWETDAGETDKQNKCSGSKSILNRVNRPGWTTQKQGPVLARKPQEANSKENNETTFYWFYKVIKKLRGILLITSNLGTFG